jgi:hypothetical protein
MHTTDFYTMIFGQRDPGKTPKGKTSEEDFIMELLMKCLQQRSEHLMTNLIQLIYLELAAPSFLKFEPVFCLGICALCLSFSTVLSCRTRLFFLEL